MATKRNVHLVKILKNLLKCFSLLLLEWVCQREREYCLCEYSHIASGKERSSDCKHTLHLYSVLYRPFLDRQGSSLSSDFHFALTKMSAHTFCACKQRCVRPGLMFPHRLCVHAGLFAGTFSHAWKSGTQPERHLKFSPYCLMGKSTSSMLCRL